jgi:tetratricopeptide (TPR) repeat protein
VLPAAGKLAPLVILVLAIGLFVWHSSSTQFLQDDSYITYRYARNVARGAGPVFNVGERVEGYTNFLWMMLLSALGVLGIPFTTVIPLSQVLGVLCGIGVIIIFFFLIRRWSTGPPAAAPLATLFLAANGSFAYWCVSGMETGLFALLIAAACLVYLDAETASGFVSTSLLLGLAALTRPEGALFWAIVLLHFVVTRATRDRRNALRPANVRDLTLLLVPFVVLVAPLYIWQLSYYGYFFPNTFYAKTGIAATYLKSGIAYLVSFYKAYGFWGLALAFPVGLALRRRSLVPALPFLFALLVLAIQGLYTIAVGGDVLRIYRFFVPVYFLFYFVLAEAVWLIPAGPAARTVLLAILVPLTFWGPFVPGQSVRREINHNKYLERGLVDKMSATGRWLNRHISERDWFACTTIGAVSWFSDRNLVDMLGLTDAVVAHHPEHILGTRVYWKERNYNTRRVLEMNPVYIYFSTGGKPSAAAERALFLRTRFRRGYFPCPVSVQERGRVFSDVLYKRRPGADTLPVETPGVNPEFVDLYNLGINLARPGKTDTAIATFRKCNAVAPPDFAYGYEWLGEIYLESKQADLAEANFTRAVEIDDWAVNAHAGLGSIYFSQRRFDSATAHFRAVVEHAPDFYDGYLNLSAALTQAADFKSAETALAQAVRRFPGVPDLELRLAYVRYLAGDFDGAERDLNAMLARSPSYQDARRLLDQVRARRGPTPPPKP